MKEKNNDVVKPVGRFIVLCCVCGKTRKGKSKWVEWKCSAAQNNGVVCSHGLCPDCTKRLYGNEPWYKQYEMYYEGRSLSGAGCSAGDRKKVLIIDDNSGLRPLLTADLETEFHVEVAENGTEGLVLAMCWRPAVILLDINMPEMSGVEVVRRLELQRETKNIPVIIVTANEYNDTTQRQLQPYGNFKGFFSKMTPSDEIRKAVLRVLS